MASPAYRNGDSTFTFGAAATSLGLAAEPAGFANGDGILASLLIEVGGTSPGTINTPSGWTLIGQIATSAFTANFYRILRGSSAPTYTFTWTIPLDGTFKYAELNVVGFSGVVGAGFLETYALGTGSTGTQPDPPAVTTVTTDTTIVTFGFSWAGWGSAASETGYTSRLGGSFQDTVVLSKALAAAGAEDPGLISAADASDVITAATFALASTGAPPATTETGIFLGNPTLIF